MRAPGFRPTVRTPQGGHGVKGKKIVMGFLPASAADPNQFSEGTMAGFTGLNLASNPHTLKHFGELRIPSLRQGWNARIDEK